MNRVHLSNTGVTLVELMIAMVLSMLLMSAVYMTYTAQHKSGTVQSRVVYMQQDLRAVMDIMERDIRNAGCNPQGAAGIQALVPAGCSSTTLQTMADLSTGTSTNPGDGDATDSDENVTYRLNGTTATLERVDNTTNTVQPLARNITQLNFTYYGKDRLTRDPATKSTEVLSIEVSIKISSDKVDPDTGNYIYRSMQRRIVLKNMDIQLDS